MQFQTCTMQRPLQAVAAAALPARMWGGQVSWGKGSTLMLGEVRGAPETCSTRANLASHTRGALTVTVRFSGSTALASPLRQRLQATQPWHDTLLAVLCCTTRSLPPPTRTLTVRQAARSGLWSMRPRSLARRIGSGATQRPRYPPRLSTPQRALGDPCLQSSRVQIWSHTPGPCCGLRSSSSSSSGPRARLLGAAPGPIPRTQRPSRTIHPAAGPCCYSRPPSPPQGWR